MPSMTYQWREGARFTIDAQKAGEQIEHLRRKSNGLLTPGQVVDDARAEDSPLHPAFEWNDGIAAERFREDQARTLIAAVVVVVRPQGKPIATRAFINVERPLGATAAAPRQQGYASLPQVLSDAALREQVLRRAWDELERWRQRYETYQELSDLFAAMDEVQRRGLFGEGGAARAPGGR